MKRETLEIFKEFMDQGKLNFDEREAFCVSNLNRAESRLLIRTQFGKAPKKVRKIKDKMRLIINGVLKVALSSYIDRSKL